MRLVVEAALREAFVLWIPMGTVALSERDRAWLFSREPSAPWACLRHVVEAAHWLEMAL